MAGLTGKVVLITGGTDGIGLAAAKALGRAGAKVVVASRRQPNVDKALGELRALGIDCDGLAAHAGKKEDIERMVAHTVQRFGGLDHLFINHAVSPGLMYLARQLSKEHPLCTEQQWDKIFDTNVKSFWMLAVAALPHMKRGSSIVINSSTGAYVPGPPTPVYGISKTALLGLMKSLAMELGPSGIRVNAVAPGVIKTRLAGYQTTGKLAEERSAATMLRRLGEPREIGDVVRFLMSDDASYLTGETMQVSGGMMAASRL
eukprot:TRINITY_DN55362_c0_g1_i1.p2 TRINITY_DN55362_c0_g1~~TRINITY_DN55362_c0_g1_i1.p2  ORF type:complete len:290 (+),score=114.31 TRINITY_DN55362_c0_g1_i1:93-872(+)